MSEVPGTPDTPEQDEFTRFLQTEADEAAREAELTEWLLNFTGEFYGYLEARGVKHCWHPDHETNKRFFAMTVEKIKQQLTDQGNEDKHHLAGTWAILYQKEERQFAFRVALAVRGVYDGRDMADITHSKKVLQAEIKLASFPEGWIEAVDMCIPGPGLEIDREEDFALYSEVMLRQSSPPEDPVKKRIGEILHVRNSSSDDPVWTTQRNAAIIHIAGNFYRTMGDLENRPNTAAAIDENLRRGTITPDEAAALHEVLDGIAGPPS
jgi:hypothetical protein